MRENLLKEAESTCSVCGKKFLIINKPEYVYKAHKKYQCSYSCYQKERKKIKDVRKIV